MSTCKYCGKQYFMQKKHSNTLYELFCSIHCYEYALENKE